MSVSLDFDFSTGADYTYDTSKIEVTGGKAKLKLIDDTGNVFTQDFSSSTGFSYNATTTEFSGGVLRQKDTRPAGAALYVPFSSIVSGVWGNGVLTGTPTGSPAIVGGKLDLTGGVNKYVTFAALNNVTAALQTGAIRFRVTPNYSGKPSTRQNFFAIGGATVNSNLTVYHDSSAGYIYVSIYNHSGSAIYSSYIQAGLYWVPVAGTEYEFELNYDVTGGDIRLFIDGTLWGVAVSGTGTRSASNLSNIWIGAIRGAVPAPSNDFSIRNVLFFDTVQHTANYTPDWSSVYDTIYASDTITCPTFTYPGVGAIQAWTTAAITDTNAPRYVLNGKYWTGSAWAASSDTWATASPSSDVIANIATLTASDTLVVNIVWNAGAVQMSTDNIVITYTGQIYPINNPIIEGNAAWMNEGLDGFVETKAITGSDDVRYILKKGTDWYYHTGTAWAVSNASYSQANTAGAIESAKATFTTAQISSKFRAFLHSDAGATTPELDNLEIAYNFSGETKDTISRCIVWGYLVDPDLSYSGSVVKAKLNENIVKYKNNITVDCSEEITATVNTANGYWEMSLVENANMPAGTRWKFSIAGETFERHVPDEITKNVYLLTYNP